MDLFNGSGLLHYDTLPVALTPIPDYANLSVQLGGGAVGVVPFDLHGPDCLPASGAQIFLSTTDPHPTEVRIRHYGPVRLAQTGSITVERTRFVVPQSWGPLPGGFTVAASSANPRDLIVTADFEPDYSYRILPNGAVLCAGNGTLDASDTAAAAYTYRLGVRTLLDRNLNGVVESGDVQAQIADPIDVNGDSAADIIDLTEVIHAASD